MDQNIIEKWCTAGALPDADIFYDALLGAAGLFDEAEGVCWDFKETWPFSLSDDYFGGIARLVCAFANTQGGVIVFGA